MCKHCEQGEVIGNFETNVGKIELFIEKGYDEISINSYETSKYGFDELTINGDIKINYCPICGRKLS
ncbi:MULTISPECIES: hypothetical protein [unclassified Clostridium]|uniref:hypothetical protein n=1 Tax=unclassified Clostridium TaxID=2614128 RepID=UPI0013EE8DB7|nr:MULTISPECIES: hypothetical protein [unclassified Clostridium]MBZ9693288.1 hypothetical protein [Clostridium sp. M14]